MEHSCQVAGCKRTAVMEWRFVSGNPMYPAGVRVCAEHVREALGGTGRLHRAILATLDVVCPQEGERDDRLVVEEVKQPAETTPAEREEG